MQPVMIGLPQLFVAVSKIVPARIKNHDLAYAQRNGASIGVFPFPFARAVRLFNAPPATRYALSWPHRYHHALETLNLRDIRHDNAADFLNVFNAANQYPVVHWLDHASSDSLALLPWPMLG